MADVSVFEDPAVARWLLDALMRDTAAQRERDRERRRNGLTSPQAMPAGALDAVQALAEVADLAMPALGSGNGTASDTLGSSSSAWMTVKEAAGHFDRSEEYTRRLAREGKVRRLRRGHMWLIDADSMERVLRRTA